MKNTNLTNDAGYKTAAALFEVMSQNAAGRPKLVMPTKF